MASGTWIEQFPGNMTWSNAALVTKGMAPYGAVALGEIDEVCERLKTRGNEPDAWQEEWCAMGARLEKVADQAAADGAPAHRRQLLSACRHVLLHRRALHLSGPAQARSRPQIAAVPARRTRAPLSRTSNSSRFLSRRRRCLRFFMKAPGVTGPAPTVVVFDGMDNCKEMSILFNGLEFAARGWHTLAIDGPGQGESLRLRGLYARHDYEVAGTAAYDYVSRRPDVDPQKSHGDGLQLRRLLFDRVSPHSKSAMRQAWLSRRCTGISRAGSVRSSAGTKWIPRTPRNPRFIFAGSWDTSTTAMPPSKRPKKFSLDERRRDRSPVRS